MNIFRREMKAHRIGLVFWCLGMVVMVASGMAKYAAYEAAGQSVTEMLATLPQSVQAVFGLVGFDLSTARGFYGVLFLYIAVMGAVHAVLLGSHVISEEERDRTSEFLYAKPVSRSRALTGKLLAGVVNVLIVNAVTFGASLYFTNYFSNEPSFDDEVATMMIGLLLLQLLFFAVGAVVAGTVRRPKKAPTIATSIMFTTFLLAYLTNLNEGLDFLKYFTPFKYFDAALMMNEGLKPVYVAISLGIIAASIVGAYRFYASRDLAV